MHSKSVGAERSAWGRSVPADSSIDGGKRGAEFSVNVETESHPASIMPCDALVISASGNPHRIGPNTRFGAGAAAHMMGGLEYCVALITEPLTRARPERRTRTPFVSDESKGRRP